MNSDTTISLATRWLSGVSFDSFKTARSFSVSLNVEFICTKLPHYQLKDYPIPIFPLPGNGLLLDLGCGWGRWTFSAVRAGYQAIGIDPERAKEHIDPSVKFAQAEGQHLPFPDNYFDVVFSYSVLQHLSSDELDGIVAEIKRVLKPDGGILLIQIAHRYGARALSVQIRRLFRKPRGREVRYYSIKQLRSIFSPIGDPEVSIHAYFGLGIEPSDADLLPAPQRSIVRLSELIKTRVGVISLADSVYVKVRKASN